MRRTVLFVACTICGLPLLCIVGLPIVWLGEANMFILPEAATVQIVRLGLTSQRIVYYLPPNRTASDIFRRLEQEGWARDIPAEQAVRRNKEELSGAFAVFWRRGWFGLASEIVLVSMAQADGQLVEVRLARCFSIAPWTRCL